MVFRRRRPLSALERLRSILWPRKGWLRGFQYIAHRVRRMRDAPERIAVGVAAGVFASFTPLFGFHLLLAAGLSWLLRGNIIAALFGTAVGNPLTFPFIAFISTRLGRLFLGRQSEDFNFKEMVEAFGRSFSGFFYWLGDLLNPARNAGQAWRYLMAQLSTLYDQIVLPYFIGGLIPGILAAVLSYSIVRRVVSRVQKRRMAMRERHRETRELRHKRGEPAE